MLLHKPSTAISCTQAGEGYGIQSPQQGPPSHYLLHMICGHVVAAQARDYSVVHSLMKPFTSEHFKFRTRAGEG
eukprot:scaffold27132_cov17-Tisochrysis_lutea.AAC.7